MKQPTKKTGTGNPRQTLHIPLLTEFFITQLKDIYWGEKHLVKTLQKMKKSASLDKLALLFEDHLEETKQHIVRLEKIFEIIDHKPVAKKCEGLEGLAKEANTILHETGVHTATRDVGIIFAMQKIEHYEIATYGSLHQLALTLELEPIADLLYATLNEEKDADESLSSIAKIHVNLDALEEA